MDPVSQTIYDGYLGETAIAPDKILLQPGETAAYRWLSLKEFLNYFDSEHCIPLIHARLEKFVNSLRKVD